MKILFLDFNLKYIVKTRNLLPEIIRRLPNTQIFGPGYNDSSVIQEGLDKFIKTQGPFDVIIATEHIMLAPYRLHLSSQIWKDRYYFTFDQDLIYKAHEYYKIFCEFKGIKIATFMESDYYNFEKIRCDDLEKLGVYILGWGPEFLTPLENIKDLALDSFTKKANNHWINFVTKNARKIISFPHFVCDTEFSKVPLEKRKRDWSIVGADYDYRQKVRNILSENKISWKGNELRLLFACLGKLKINANNKKMFINFLNYQFKRLIAVTKFSYTDGSRLRYPIRKYFEIPALGSVLVCDPCIGFGALGFIDGENALLASPENLMDIHQILKKDIALAQEIAIKGQQLVESKHTVVARAQQLKIALEAIASNTFEGSYWEGGQFFLKNSLVV